MGINTCSDYQIAATLVKLAALSDLNIPDPDLATYNEFSVRNITGTLTQRGDGFPIATWQWNLISRQALYRLTSLCSTNASASIYIRTRTNGAGQTFANYSAKLLRPALDGSDGTPSPKDVNAYENVKIEFIGLESA